MTSNSSSQPWFRWWQCLKSFRLRNHEKRNLVHDCSTLIGLKEVSCKPECDWAMATQMGSSLIFHTDLVCASTESIPLLWRNLNSSLSSTSTAGCQYKYFKLSVFISLYLKCLLMFLKCNSVSNMMLLSYGLMTWCCITFIEEFLTVGPHRVMISLMNFWFLILVNGQWWFIDFV